jgi:SAM-dependent methyltransferase
VGASEQPACPVCASRATSSIAAHSAREAVRHFEVGYGFADRHGKLRAYLEQLWAPGGSVEVRRCEECGFGFAWPHRAGDADFYNLVTGGTPEYPQARWEFGRTADAIEAETRDRRLRVLEAGAGDGAFLNLLRERLAGDLDATALEYDRGALEGLRTRGFDSREGSLEDLAADPAEHGGYDAVCLFQALEHMDRPLDVRAAIVSLARDGGHVFISVPNGAAIDAQERLTGFRDMPPNHVGRWTHRAMAAWASGGGLEVVESDLEQAPGAALVAAYAGQRLMADRYPKASLPSLAQRTRHPIAIDVLTKRRRRRYESEGREMEGELLPPTYWAHLVKQS